MLLLHNGCRQKMSKQSHASQHTIATDVDTCSAGNAQSRPQAIPVLSVRVVPFLIPVSNLPLKLNLNVLILSRQAWTIVYYIY